MNGNMVPNTIKIMHWNKGNSLFSNKVDDLYFLIDKYKPHFISLSEANYNNMDGEQIRGYSVEMNDLGIGYKISRVVTLIHSTLNYTRRKDLEQNYLAAIVCDVKLSNKSNFTIISHYRQWNLPRDINIVNDLDNNQCNRYQNYIQMY